MFFCKTVTVNLKVVCHLLIYAKLQPASDLDSFLCCKATTAECGGRPLEPGSSNPLVHPHITRKEKLHTGISLNSSSQLLWQTSTWLLSLQNVIFFSLFLPVTCTCREGSSNEVPILVVGNKRDLQRQRFMPRRAVSVLVKKTWKCGYVECSAKYNWHVVLLFKELLGIAVARGMRLNHTSIRLQGALQRNRCTIMWRPSAPSTPLTSVKLEWKKKNFYLNGWKNTLWPPALLSWFFIMRFIISHCNNTVKFYSWSSNHYLVDFCQMCTWKRSSMRKQEQNNRINTLIFPHCLSCLALKGCASQNSTAVGFIEYVCGRPLKTLTTLSYLIALTHASVLAFGIN